MIFGTKWLRDSQFQRQRFSGHIPDGIYPSITSTTVGKVRDHVPVVVGIRVPTHVKPVCAILDHPLAFSSELAKVRREDRGGDDCSRHSLSGLQEMSGMETFVRYMSSLTVPLHVTRGFRARS